MDTLDRLEMSIAYCSSEEPHFPSREIVRQGPVVGRGWHAACHCSYPQTIGIKFILGEVQLSRLQILCNDSKVPRRIEVHLATPEGPNIAFGTPAPFQTALFRNCGYITFQNNSESQFRSGELRVLSIEQPVLYVKLVLSEPHPHPMNTFQQVGIISVVALGKVQRVVLPASAAHLMAAANAASQDPTSMIEYFKGGAMRDVSSDRQALQKIEEMDQAKLRMISIEDFESARRIKEQLEELVPLAFTLADFEHRKRKAIAEEDYNEAQRLKHIITRMRAYVESLKPGMPFQRFDLQAMIDASLLSVVDPAVKQSPTGVSSTTTSSPHRSFVKHRQHFDEIPVGGGNGSSAFDPNSLQFEQSQSQPDAQREEEAPLLLSHLTDAGETSRAAEVRSYLPAGSEQMNPETVSEARACDINGWKKMLDVFGFYLCCCLFSRKFQIREAAFEFLRHEAHRSDTGENTSVIKILSKKFSCREGDIALSLLFCLSAPETGVHDGIPSVLFPACDLCQALFQVKPFPKSQDTNGQKLCVQTIVHALLNRVGDSNARVRQAVEATADIVGASPLVGVDTLCGYALGTKTKFARHAEEIIRFVTKYVTLDATSALPSCLNISNVHKTLLKPSLAHANKGVRDAAMHLLVQLALKLGQKNSEVKSVLSSLKPAQQVVVKKALEAQATNSNAAGSSSEHHVTIIEAPTESQPVTSKKNAGSRNNEDTNETHSTTAELLPQRRTIEETQKMYPDVAETFVFKSSSKSKLTHKRDTTPPPTLQMLTNDEQPEQLANGEHAVVMPKKPSVLKQKLDDAVEASKSVSQLSPIAKEPSISGVSSPSSLVQSPSRHEIKAASPQRRQPPLPIEGVCQFCHEHSDDFHNRDKLLEHFFGECPMLCTCPLCHLPVEIREVHWHLSEDCVHKNLVKRCPLCYECVQREQYDEHVKEAKCVPWVNGQFSCPLCHEKLLSDDVFWEAHILYPPFCPQNPRTFVHDDDSEGVVPAPPPHEDDEEQEEAQEDEDPIHNLDHNVIQDEATSSL